MFLVASENYSNRDCVLIAIMTHGDENALAASDATKQKA